MIKLNIITLFPDIINKHLEYLPFKKAIELGEIEVNVVNLRDYGLDNYGTVDGKTYGGGTGMLLRIEPIYNALSDLKVDENRSAMQKNILLSPKGQKYSQKAARELTNTSEITLICGRYEGVDARMQHFIDDTYSAGDYVLSGGELPALIIAESITRLLPGVLEKSDATQIESFAEGSENKLEFPQYTRPEDFKGHKVPEVLLSGDHKKIAKWRENNSKKIAD